MNTEAKALFIVLAITVLLSAGCSRLDGADPGDGGATGADGGLISGVSCSADLECGAGRYCGDAKICAIDCVTSKDCAYQLSDPGISNDLECSACGRCLAKGAKDTSCVMVTDIPCATDDECKKPYGDNFVCHPTKKTCVRKCMQDKNCSDVGRGWYCGDDKLCYRKCTRDLDCILHGWHMVCDLPPGTDGDANAYSAKPIVSECVPREGGVDWGGNTDPSKGSFKYHGVWGMELNTAVRTFGLPLVNTQDTVSNQYLLTKVTQDGNNLTFNLKWCTLDLKNFKENDEPFTDAAWIITPDRYADHIFIQYLHGYNVPAMTGGAAFTTDQLVEIRGAKLAVPETDALPDWDHPEKAWDQDMDGHPGMTNFMAGMLTGEIYNVQRWTCIMNASVVDDNHLMGLVEHTSEQNVVGASTDTFNYSLTYIKHPQADRSFFKMLRMDDTASCNDVIRERKKTGSWLYFDIGDKASIHYNPNAKP